MLCEGCNLCEGAKTPCLLGRGNPDAKIMIIQDSPNELDDKKGKTMVGKSCDNLRKSMDKREIDVSEIYWTSLLKCPLPPSGKANSKQLTACTKVLEAEIQMVNPDIIVPMGNLSLRYCLGQGALTKVRGNAQEVELVGRKRIILPTMHPRMALTKPLYKDYILNDLDTLKGLLDNGIPKVKNVDYKSPETLDEVLAELDRLNKEAKELSFDLETTGKSPYLSWSKIVCISLSDKERTGSSICLYHRETPFNDKELKTIVKALKKLLENPKIPKVAQNGKFDIEWLDVQLDIKVANFNFDTQIAHYICISEELGTQGLKSQAWEFTDMGGYDNALDEYKSTLSDGEGELSRNNYDRIPWSILSPYACCDVDCALRLKHIYEPLIQENPKWEVLMREILMPASYTMKEIEKNGMKFDLELSEKYKQTYGDEINRITSRLESYPEVVELEREKRELWKKREQLKLIPKKDRTPEEQEQFTKYGKYKDYKFNWGSVQQLSELLYDKLELKTSITTDTGNLSTSEEALNEISNQHEIPKLLLELRKVTTLNNMFIQKLPTMCDDSGIIHPSFNICGTVTGRTSSENPNQQQLPRKSENPLLFQYQNEPKALFISRFGEEGCIMNADYSALEMRIAGIISEDQTLLQAFLSGKDLHKSTASLVWKVPIEEVSKDLRTQAKSVNFGIIYGKSSVTFASDLYYDPSGKNPDKTSDWDKAKAMGDKLVSDYLNTFSDLNRWLKQTKKSAMKLGYVETMFGRRRRLPDLKSKSRTLASEAERQAINAPIQGTGSDFTLMSLTNIQNELTKRGFKTKLICTVHDSIVFDVFIPELPEVGALVKQIMEHVHEPYIDTPVPIVADLELGTSYGKMWETTLEEVKTIQTVSDFKIWVHKKSIEKYQFEIDTFVKKGMNVEETLAYMKTNDRPILELKDYIIEAYSKEEETQ